MTTEEMIASLEDQAQDKDRLAGGDPDSVFTADATVLIEAAKLLRAQQSSAKLDRSRWEGCEYCVDVAPQCYVNGIKVVKFQNGYFFPFLQRSVSDCEVIGNIHDNPELLEVQR